MDSLEIIFYPHPALRHQSKPIQRVDSQLKQIVDRMFELMYEHKGIGLAANQVNLPLQVFIINVEGNPDAGEEMVFINPVIDSPKSSSMAEEGCLSIPTVYGNVARPESVRIKAYNLKGEMIDQQVDGLLARAIQHEVDHINGVLFPDRMSAAELKSIEDELREFEIEFESRRRTGAIPADEDIKKRLAEFEARYC
jgi:peptide deformylase